MFTRNQIEEIKKKLIIFGTKDTQFPDAHKLSGDEIIAIVQDGENRKIPLSSIVELLSDTSVSPNDDFINVSKDTTVILTLDTAVSKVDINNRKLGQVITFKDSADSWSTYQFTGSSLDSWNNASLWKNITGSGESGIEELKSRVDDNTASIASIKNDVSINTQDIDSLADEIDKNAANINGLQSSVTALENREALTASSINGLKETVSNLTSQVNTNTGNITSLTSQVDTNTTDIASLNTEVNALSDSLDAITTKVKVLTQEEYSLLDAPDPNTIYFIRG